MVVEQHPADRVPAGLQTGTHRGGQAVRGDGRFGVDEGHPGHPAGQHHRPVAGAVRRGSPSWLSVGARDRRPDAGCRRRSAHRPGAPAVRSPSPCLLSRAAASIRPATRRPVRRADRAARGASVHIGRPYSSRRPGPPGPPPDRVPWDGAGARADLPEYLSTSTWHRTGCGSNRGGGPVRELVALAHRLPDRGPGLSAGSVLHGTVSPPLPYRMRIRCRARGSARARRPSTP